jgi:nickel-dependent lactate racemase
MVSSLSPGRPLRDEEIEAFLRRALPQALGEAPGALTQRGGKILVIIPDATRTLPMPLLFRTLIAVLGPRAEVLDFLVALGTHPGMSGAQLAEHLGGPVPEGVRILQHRWNDLASLVSLAQVPAAEMQRLSSGLLTEPMPIRLNRVVLEHDLVLLVGPVFPHELVGFSGGHKYYFPGVSGPEILDQSHWLGALIGNTRVNGRRRTPVRELIERAAVSVPVPARGISLVMKGELAMGVYVGPVYDAWAEAVELSSRLNIVRVPRSFHTVLSLVPRRYPDLWTGAKCMTKLEAVVADGGRLILYGPHIREAAPAYGGWHERVGYHLPQYVLAHPERYAEVPRAALADLIQLRGGGSYVDGEERPRIQVLLATGIPEAVCRRLNLGYLDPATLRPDELAGREEQGILVVPSAGETLYRLAGEQPGQEPPGGEGPS